MTEVKAGNTTSEFAQLGKNNKMAWISFILGLLIFGLGGAQEILQDDPGVSAKVLMFIGLALKMAAMGQKLLGTMNWTKHRSMLKSNAAAMILLLLIPLGSFGCETFGGGKKKSEIQKLSTIVDAHTSANNVMNAAAAAKEISIETFEAYIKVSDELYDAEELAYEKHKAGEQVSVVFWQEQILDKLAKLVAWQLEVQMQKRKKKKETRHGNRTGNGTDVGDGGNRDGASGAGEGEGRESRNANGRPNERYAKAWRFTGSSARDSSKIEGGSSGESTRSSTFPFTITEPSTRRHDSRNSERRVAA